MDGSFEVRKESGRVYVETDGDYDYDETVATLSRILVSWVSVRSSCMRMRALTSSVKQLSSISTMYTRIRAYLQGKCETCQKELSDDLHGDKCRSW